jgi:transcriptional regulator with XRE-family HTH domain
MMRGMNQVDLAQASGVSQNTISEIETGRREARAATLRKLARTLEVEIADLLDGDYPKAPALPLRDTDTEATAPPDTEVIFDATYSPETYAEVKLEAEVAYQDARRNYVLEGVHNLVHYYESGDRIVVRIEPVSSPSSRSRRRSRMTTKTSRGRAVG